MAKAKVKSTARQRDGEYGIMGDMESKKALVAEDNTAHYEKYAALRNGGLFMTTRKTAYGCGLRSSYEMPCNILIVHDALP